MYKQSVDEMIEQVLIADNSAETQDQYTPYQVAQFLDREIQGTLVPTTISVYEEYLVTHSHFNIDSSNARITIPGDAAGFRVRDVYLFPQNAANQQLIKAIRLNPDQLPYIVPGSQTAVYGGVYGNGPTYYIENNDIVFYPAPQQPMVVRVRYLKQPNHVYPLLYCTTQVLVKTPTNTLVLSSIPTGLNPTNDSAATQGLWTNNTGVNATTFDVIRPDMPFNFRFYSGTDLPIINESILSVNTGTNEITVSDDVYAAVQVGDFLATSGTFGYLQYLPYQANNLAILRASMLVLKAQGDFQGLGITAQLFNAANDDYKRVITPKVENSTPKVSNFNSPIGRAGYSGGGGRR